MKKINFLLSFALMLSMLFTSAVPAYAADVSKKPAENIELQVNNPTMTVDGQETAIDDNGTTPIILDGRTILPVRAVVEAMGGSVSWDEASQTVTLSHEENEIKLTIGNLTAYIDGVAQMLDVPPSIINGRTMLPIRFIAESFGYQVGWEEATKIITITRDAAEDVIKDNSQTILVVYFSMPETDNPNDMTVEEANSTVVINGEVMGNTQYLAYVIQESTGGDIFRIEPETPYPLNHTTLVEQAKEEQNNKFRPVIKTKIENIEQYDTIFLGYPNWWGDMPMILYSFLERYDLSGKTIIPFNTHGGSGFSNTISTISSLQPNATVVKDGLTISRDNIQNAENDIKAWVLSIMSENK